MFAVVEDQQDLPTAQKLKQGVEQGSTRLLVHAQDLRHGSRDEGRIGNRRELDEPHACSEAINKRSGDLQRESRLAHAADTHEREQARGRH